jgi:autotransporter-associated beta strand protein
VELFCRGASGTPSPIQSRFSGGLSVFAAVLILLPAPVFATDRTWTGATNTDWGTNTNWTGGHPSAGDNALFNSTFSNQPNLGSSASAGGIWMTGSIGQNVTISGSTLTLQGNTINGTAGLGILVDNANAFTLTITAPVTLGNNQTWRNNSANLLTIGAGGVNTGGKTWTIDGTGNTTISGVISSTGAVTKAGSGTLTLSNTGNTYTGQLTVQAGTLSIDTINNASANGELGNNALSVILGSSGATGTLEYTGGTASSTKTFTMATSGTGAFQVDTAATTLTLSGVIGGSGALNKTGAGTLVLSGANTYTGKTSIQNGALSVSSLNKVTGGTASSGLGAPTTVANGTIDLGSGTTTGTLIYTGSGETTDRVINLAGTTGGGAIENDGSGAVTFSSNLTATGAGSKTLTLQGSNTGSNTISGAIVDNSSSNTTSLTKAGAGTWVLSGANTYTGATIINAGTLSLDNAGSTTARLANTSGITVNSGGTLLLTSSSGSSNDRINNSATMTLNGGTFNTGGLSEHGASNNTAGIGALTLQSTSIIDMGNGASIVAFANSKLSTWSGTLKIYNWSGTPLTGGGTDQLFFGSDVTGLTAAQLLEIQFYSGSGTGAYGAGALILANGEVVPVPEPSTYLAALLALGTVAYHRPRRKKLLV